MKLNDQQIIDYIVLHPGSTAASMKEIFGVVNITMYRRLSLLVKQWKIIKKWTTPRVKYYPMVNTETKNTYNIPAHISRLLTSERYQLTNTWAELIGTEWFVRRCKKRSIEPVSAAHRRHRSIQYIDTLTTSHGITAIQKLDDYGYDILSNLWYGAIYALPEFGKTKQGTWMEIAKVQPNNRTFASIIQYCNQYIQAIIDTQHVDALAFAQPTAKRTMQIMRYAQKIRWAKLPVLPVEKIPGFFPAQKTLKKRSERIENAQTTFELGAISQAYEHVLIIDDAVWSGATLVEIWRKLLETWKVKNISAFAMTGTANGLFDDYKHFEVLTGI